MKLLKYLLVIISICFSFTLSSQPCLYYNGNIFTSDSSLPIASYFIVDHGIITKIGNSINKDSIALFHNRIDLKNACIIPGIVDSHVHFIDGALGLLQISLSDITNADSLRLKLTVTKSNLIDGIYVARDLGSDVLNDIKSPVTFLDSIFGEIPTIIFLKSGHAAICNKSGLKKLGFTKHTRFKDGKIQLDNNNNPNGWLLEEAAMEASKRISSIYSSNTLTKAILKAQSLALSYGITTIGDNTFSPFHLKIYQKMQQEGALKLRVWARSYGRIPETKTLMQSMGNKKLGFIGKATDFSRVHFHAIKQFVDMSLSGNYRNGNALEPGGTVFLQQKQLKNMFLLNPINTYAFHVQGKSGIQQIINSLDEIGIRNNHRRHVIDHAGYVSKDQLYKLNKLNAGVTILASQTFDYTTLVHEYNNNPNFNEEDLLDVRSKFKIVRGALSSDFPYGMDTKFKQYKQVDGLNPFANIAVNTSAKLPDKTSILGFNHKILTINEAINSYTINGAYVLGADKLLGKIATGYKADFNILSENIFKENPIQLYDAQVTQSYIEGEKVFDRNLSKENSNTVFNKNISRHDYAISPIFGYDPTVGFIYGAACFIFPLQTPSNYADLQVQATEKSNLSIQGSFIRYGIKNKLDFKLAAQYTDFVQYYFGEGDNTNADNYKQIFSKRYVLLPEFQYALTNNVKFSILADYRARTESKIKTKDDIQLNETLFPNENTLGLGLSLSWDTRDNSFSTKNGFYLKTSTEYIPSTLNIKNYGSASLYMAEFRYFHYLYTSKYVFATRVSIGLSSGNPGYLFKYTLGGSQLLRGNYTNRFRGEKYYLLQGEFRFPIYKVFSGVGFIESGDITNTHFSKLLSSYGAGIRFNIRENVILRLDYGFGKKQEGLFFTFGEAF